jgi:hypothetical protein
MKNKTKRENIVDRYKIFSFREPTCVNLKDIADKAGMNVNALLRTALLEYIERNKLTS